MSKKLKVAFINQPLDHVLPPHQNSIGIWTYQVARRITDSCDLTCYAKLMQGTTDKVEYDGEVRYQFMRMVPIRLWDKFGELFSRFYSTQKPLFAAGFYFIDFILPIAIDIKRKKFDVVHIHNFTQFVPIVRALNPTVKIVLHMNGEWLSQLDRGLMAARMSKADLILGSSDHIRDLARKRFPEFFLKIQTVYNGVDTDHFVSNNSIQGSAYVDVPDVQNLAVNDPVVKHSALPTTQDISVTPQKSDTYFDPEVAEVTTPSTATQTPITSSNSAGTIVNNALSGETLLFVGRISPEKGIHILIDAFSIVGEHRANTQLLIVGPEGEIAFEYLVGLSDDPQVAALAEFYDDTHPEPSYTAHLRQRIPSHLEDRVVFTGPIAQTDLIEYYYNADILVNPSFSESFGMSLAEAMACERPVIASRVGGMKGIVEEGITGYLVEQGDPQELADTILALLEQPKKRKKMGKAGRIRSLALFSWDQVSQQWLTLVGELYEHSDIRTSAI